MRVLGVDPGSVVCGYGVIEKQGKHITLIEYGVIEAKRRHEDLPQRLKVIYERLGSVIRRSLPDELAIESIFHAKNVSSIVKLAHARSAAILAAVMAEVPTTEYAPRLVKRAVTGNGSASKEQVQYMIKTLLDIEETPDFFDVTDALAVALCHLYQVSALASASSSRRRSGGKAAQASPTQRQKKAATWEEFVAAHPHRIKGGL
jgi:crossover junction endodeoxyribonuclease RuvC